MCRRKSCPSTKVLVYDGCADEEIMHSPRPAPITYMCMHAQKYSKDPRYYVIVRGLRACCRVFFLF